MRLEELPGDFPAFDFNTISVLRAMPKLSLLPLRNRRPYQSDPLFENVGDILRQWQFEESLENAQAVMHELFIAKRVRNHAIWKFSAVKHVVADGTYAQQHVPDCGT